MNLLEITALANGPVNQLIGWMQDRHLLANPLQCIYCHRNMVMVPREQNHIDGFQWRCQGCRRKCSIRSGSIFNEFPRTSLAKLVNVIYLWSLRELRVTVSSMLSITPNQVGNIYSLLRHLCGRDLTDRPVIPFGGHVFVTKCDESKFRHKSKYNRGRRAAGGQWVFGVVSTEFSPCRGYFQVVRRRDRATLTQILQRVLLPGSEVHSDDWGAYANLPQHVPNVRLHRVVVHRDNFVHPVTGVHTQEIESAWNRLKYFIKRERGVRSEILQGFLNEQMWRDWKGNGNIFDNILLVISFYYQF